jgi:aspartyl-tRNA(Asn)/glutamyl-tRNA(Gln) amidotransferase subunit A
MKKNTLTIEEINTQLTTGQTTVRAIVDAYLARLNETTDLNIVRGVYSDVDQQILRAQEMLDNKTSTVLTGIPFAIKDNILVEGQAAGASSKILENYKATYDATVIEKLKKAGAILLARTNMDEFAMGSSTENSAYGVTKNPIDITRVPGGSSGGSAAAVAAGVSVVALGTDTGGSIRQPASFCGIVGLKPTYGAVSRYGAISMGSSLDQIGPFGNCVRDTEIVFDCIQGSDAKDATTIEEKDRKSTSGNKKIGIPYDFVKKDGVDPQVIENFNNIVEGLRTKGYKIVDISLPYMHYALSVYYILMPAEVSSNLARFDGIRYGLSVPGSSSAETFAKSRGTGFGREVRRRILLGTYILSHGYYDAYYNKAIIVREKIKKEFEEVFEDVSLIMTPTTPTTAFLIGEKSSDPLAMYLADIFTVPANIAGVPALSVPSGLDTNGLPFSVQFTAPYFCEKRLFEIGKAVEDLLQ